MAPSKEKSQLKRPRQSQGEQQSAESKKPRRSERISSQHQNGNIKGAATKLKNSQLPSPVTNHHSGTENKGSEDTTEAVSTSPVSQFRHRTPPTASQRNLNIATLSPPSDTQPFSQLIHPPKGLSSEVKDEEEEGVWGYLLPLDHKFGDTLVMRRRAACPVPPDFLLHADGEAKVNSTTYEKQEQTYENTKINDVPSGGYLIGRHPECDRVLNVPTISNRHCLIFPETKGGDTVAVLEDLSGNGTFVNESYVGRNKRRQLRDGDEIAILDEARFIFRYPASQVTHGFRQQYKIQEQLGKGHFASVYLCVEKSTGMKYAVKKFEKRSGPGEKSKTDGLQQEIAMLMAVSHPNVLCLKDTFEENDGVYLVLELAVEGELFNWIILNSKLSETQARRVFIQLFQGIKYLHERNIVHRDIKPENILLVDKDLSVKLADFGLAKIIGEESFTTTLCGTPSYVAPEILSNLPHRRYTRAVDVWSLGVVLYICLCGFPPFSDELYRPENPYTLSEQIKMARFDYPSPYWDPVSDLALDLIDRMLTVDVNKRITVDGCLEHPWITQNLEDSSGKGMGNIAPGDSTDGLTGAMGQLDFSKKRPQRERTLLSSLNDVKVTRTVDVQPGVPPLKVFSKNEGEMSVIQCGEKQAVKSSKASGRPSKEAAPHTERNPKDFMQMGDVGDQPLFGEDVGSRYSPEQAMSTKAQSGKAEQKAH